MAGTPETLYARDGDSHHLPYQIVGEGPDLLFVPTATFPIDLLWDEPTVACHLRRLASFSRLILTDLLGTGSSDAVPIHDRPAMQAWTDGLVAVLDAVGSEGVSVFAMSESALPVMLLTASHPHRVRSLALFGPFARYMRAADQPFGMPESALARYLDGFERTVGTGRVVDNLARRAGRVTPRSGAGGRAASAFPVVPDTSGRCSTCTCTAMSAPRSRASRRRHCCCTAVVTATCVASTPGISPSASRTRDFVELDGDDNIWFAGDADGVLDEIESFLTGGRGAAPSNRVLSTVLFTDIVGSTERAGQLGDEAWTAALAAHNRLVERYVAGARGVVVKFTGDGALATFDGPARAINCACAIRDAVEDLGVEIRAGLHTGEVELVDGDVHGIAVHIAARIMALAAAGEVLVSGVIPPLVLGSRIAFTDRGIHELKGLPDRWPVLAVRDIRD